jgi:hypothetical protein
MQAENIRDTVLTALWLASRQSEIALFRSLQRVANDPDFMPTAKSHNIDAFLTVLNQVPSDIRGYVKAFKVVESPFLARSVRLSWADLTEGLRGPNRPARDQRPGRPTKACSCSTLRIRLHRN